MSAEALIAVAILLFGWSVVSGRLERVDVTGPIVFVAAGLLLSNGPSNVVDVTVESHAVHGLAEVTLALLLFSDAARVSPHDLRRSSGLPARLLAIGLPLTFALGAGLAALVPEPGIPTRFWGGMVRMLAEVLNVTLDGLAESVERYYAESDFVVRMGPVPKGTLAAIRFEVAGLIDGEPRLFAEHVTRLRDDMAPEWPRPPTGGAGIHRVEIEGDPSLRLDLSFPARESNHVDDALIGTAARLLSAVPAIVKAEPGIVSALDVPLARGRNILVPSG